MWSDGSRGGAVSEVPAPPGHLLEVAARLGGVLQLARLTGRVMVRLSRIVLVVSVVAAGTAFAQDDAFEKAAAEARRSAEAAIAEGDLDKAAAQIRRVETFASVGAAQDLRRKYEAAGGKVYWDAWAEPVGSKDAGLQPVESAVAAESPSPTSKVSAGGDDQSEANDGLGADLPETNGRIVLSEGRAQALYDAVATSDVISFGCVASDEFRDACANARSLTEFQKDALRNKIRASASVAADLKRARVRLAKKKFAIRAKGASVSYQAGKFWLALASWEEKPDQWSLCQQADLYGDATAGVTAGLWKKLKVGSVAGFYSGSVELTGLSESVKETLEKDFGRTVFAEWRWSGLGEPKKLTSRPFMGFISTNTWIVPSDLTLVLVRKDGTDL